MSRTLASAVANALDDDRILPMLFVHLAFDTGPVYVHTDLGDITTLSQTWTGIGDLGKVETMTESADLRSERLQLTLTLVDETAGSIYEEASNQNFHLGNRLLSMVEPVLFS